MKIFNYHYNEDKLLLIYINLYNKNILLISQLKIY